MCKAKAQPAGKISRARTHLGPGAHEGESEEREGIKGLGRTLDPARPPEKLMFSVTPRKLMLSAIVFFTSLPLMTCSAPSIIKDRPIHGHDGRHPRVLRDEWGVAMSVGRHCEV